MSDKNLTRRAFLAATTTTAAIALTGAANKPNTARVVPRKISPNEKLNVAGIGVGGKGAGDIISCKRLGENVVALCDADWMRAEQAFVEIPDAKRFKDYRVMLEEMPEIDACTISTPDHTHAPAAYLAMNMGKHVYVQKPLTHTVAEARLLTQLARETKVATQMGNQGHCGNGVRNFCEVVWDNAIGPITKAHIWTNRPVWPQAIQKPEVIDPIRETLDWNLWIGSAPMRSYVDQHPETGKDCYCPFTWRGWWDFGCGALGDMACHIMDPAFWGLHLGDAASCTVEIVKQEGMNDQTGPAKSILKYTFPARGDMPPVEVFWYDGGYLPERPEAIPADVLLGTGDNGSLFEGEKGYLTCDTYGENPRLLPQSFAEGYTPPEPYLERIENEDPYLNWIKACKGGEPAASNFDYSGPFTEVVNLGNVALLAGEKVEYDMKSAKITNSEKGNQLLTKQYRKGWELPC